MKRVLRYNNDSGPSCLNTSRLSDNLTRTLQPVCPDAFRGEPIISRRVPTLGYHVLTPSDARPSCPDAILASVVCALPVPIPIPFFSSSYPLDDLPDSSRSQLLLVAPSRLTILPPSIRKRWSHSHYSGPLPHTLPCSRFKLVFLKLLFYCS